MDSWQFYTLLSLIVVFGTIPLGAIASHFWRKFSHNFKKKMGEEYKITIIQEIHTALEALKKQKVGGTFIIDQFNDVTPYIIDNEILDAKLSPNLLINIFEGHTTPLHDGAVIISANGRIKSAAAYITRLSTEKIVGKKMGTRHRSAKGLSEVSRSIAIVLSEETGNVTIFSKGQFWTIKAKEFMQKMSEVWIQ